MSNYVETIFLRGSDLPGRELHCQMDDSNRVSWQEVPVGEQGTSRPFETSEQAARFMYSNARVLGYKVPSWARFYKADSF